MENTEPTKKTRPINPLVDWGFKYVFGREENKDLMIGFLNLLLEPEKAIHRGKSNKFTERRILL